MRQNTSVMSEEACSKLHIVSQLHIFPCDLCWMLTACEVRLRIKCAWPPATSLNISVNIEVGRKPATSFSSSVDKMKSTMPD